MPTTKVAAAVLNQTLLDRIRVDGLVEEYKAISLASSAVRLIGPGEARAARAFVSLGRRESRSEDVVSVPDFVGVAPLAN